MKTLKDLETVMNVRQELIKQYKIIDLGSTTPKWLETNQMAVGALRFIRHFLDIPEDSEELK